MQNIGQAARSINGTLLLPGETFSLNKTLGERTVANGYTKGFVVGPGGVFKEDLGGGVSTSATTTWTAAFYAGLQRVHTQAHSIWISRYRAGLEATVAWGSFDMSFKNDTPHAVYITTVMKQHLDHGDDVGHQGLRHQGRVRPALQRRAGRQDAVRPDPDLPRAVRRRGLLDRRLPRVPQGRQGGQAREDHDALPPEPDGDVQGRTRRRSSPVADPERHDDREARRDPDADGLPDAPDASVAP